MPGFLPEYCAGLKFYNSQFPLLLKTMEIVPVLEILEDVAIKFMMLSTKKNHSMKFFGNKNALLGNKNSREDLHGKFKKTKRRTKKSYFL